MGNVFTQSCTTSAVMASSGPSDTNQLGLDQSTRPQGTTGGSHTGMGGPTGTNQLGLDQTDGQSRAATETLDSGMGQGTTGVSGRNVFIVT